MIRLGIVASPEQSIYLDWADQRLDKLAAITREANARRDRGERERRERRFQAHPSVELLQLEDQLRARGYTLDGPR